MDVAILGAATTALAAGWVLLGAMHALEPGHGKSLVAAYLVGARGRVFDAVVLGVTVTITHTATAVALGVLIGLFGEAMQGRVAGQALQIVSASLVLGIGAWMFRRLAHGRGHHHHDHGHDHGHDHDHDHDHAAGDATAEPRSIFGAGGVIGLGVSGGLIPCPAALAVVVSMLGRAGTWMALGTVLLFSAGMGVVLTGIGIAFVKFGRLLAGRQPGRWVNYMPAVSAFLVTLIGLALLVLAIGWPETMAHTHGGGSHVH